MILNWRPLGGLHDDEVEQILTPNHLFFGRKLNVENVTGKFDTNKSVDLNKQLNILNLKGRNCGRQLL